MKVLAVSDIHIDYAENLAWLRGLSRVDHREDVLILAGDVSSALPLVGTGLALLAERFRVVLFVPGNHDLWVGPDPADGDSFAKYRAVERVARESGATLGEWREGALRIVPLLGWYDFSFGEPEPKLLASWADFRACRWPAGFGAPEVASEFLRRNEPLRPATDAVTLTFSHFLPRIDVMSRRIPDTYGFLHPVLGSRRLDEQVRALGGRLHVYGHSHVNQRTERDGVTYVNNAFGYPRERRIARKQLVCVYET
ncbi:metallophosphoesterase [Salinarimonas rosea]|uniref:metallophosphoesterase n=1 Tax=Salinarimonas rosea TaxID=552063 RepID=UPI0003F7E43D|nr:metallophosphoesterase [Salinarimonas rosea]